MIAFAVGDVLGIVANAEGRVILLPSWAWFVIGTFALFLAQFLVFHDVRKQRDELEHDTITVLKQLSEGAKEKLLELKSCLEGIPHSLTKEPIIEELNLFGLIELITRPKWGYSGTEYENYWVLTKLGKTVILRLQKSACKEC
jgi:hypothetical protein